MLSRRITALLVAVPGLVLVVAGLTRVDAGRGADPAGRILVWALGLAFLAAAVVRWRGPSGGQPPRLASEPTPGALVFEGVRVRRGSRLVLADVSFTVAPGEAVALLGRNGAGKTTLIDVCCGLLGVDAGAVAVDGAAAGSKAARRSLGLVPQDSALYDELTVVENLRVAAALHEVQDVDARIDEVVALLGLSDVAGQRAGRCSGGQRRRLALARALLHRPRVLVLDEPTLGVDAHGRLTLWEELRELRGSGVAILLTTNMLEEAVAVCDRVVVLEDQTVLADLPPAELGSGAVLRIRCADPAAGARALAAMSLPATAQPDGVLQVRSSDAAQTAAVLGALSEATKLLELDVRPGSIDEGFRRLTAGRS